VNGQLARWRVGQVRFSTFRWTRSATPRAGEPPDNFIRSAVAEAAGDGVVVGEAAAAADALAATEADSVAAAAVAEAEEVLSSALARLTLAGVITAGTVAGVAALSSTDAYAMPSPATVPPLPPIPASGKFPPYTPAGQAAALAWDDTMDTRDPVYGTPDDIAYQVRVAGQPELYVPYAAGGGKWADGYRPSDGAIIDA